MAERLNRIAILASGDGTTAEAFGNAIGYGLITGHEIGLVVCSKPEEELENGGIYTRMRNLNKLFGFDIETIHISNETNPRGYMGIGQTNEESSVICERVAELDIDHVALMGYMRIVRGDLLQEYGWHPKMISKYEARMSNTHPGPLPETANTFKLSSSKTVLELELRQSAHTHHLVASRIDEGPIISSHTVEVLPYDDERTLNDRVRAVEKIALPYSIDKYISRQKGEFYV